MESIHLSTCPFRNILFRCVLFPHLPKAVQTRLLFPAARTFETANKMKIDLLTYIPKKFIKASTYCNPMKYSMKYEFQVSGTQKEMCIVLKALA